MMQISLGWRIWVHAWCIFFVPGANGAYYFGGIDKMNGSSEPTLSVVRVSCNGAPQVPKTRNTFWVTHLALNRLNDMYDSVGNINS